MSNTADFTIKYEKDGKDYTWTGKGTVTVDKDVDYDYATVDGYYDPVRVFKNYERTTVTLGDVTDLKGRAVMKKDESMNRVTTTRKILVDDFTFGSIANARKKAGAPKDSTFEVGDGYNTEGTRREKFVTFIWTEVL